MQGTYCICRVVGATYANRWLIIVGASKTSPVPGNGIRRRHARRQILPRFGALRGDNTPSPALRGLRMITRSTPVATSGSLSCFARGRRRARLALLFSLGGVWNSMRSTLCMGVPGGLFRPTPRGTIVIRLGTGPSRQCLCSPASPPAVGSRRLPAPWSTGRPHRLGSCRRLLTVAALLMMRALSR